MMRIPSNISSINVWVIGFVISLHGLTMWAVASVDSPKPLEAKTIKPQVIQLELVTLPTHSIDIKPNAKPKFEPESKIQPAKPVEKIKPNIKRADSVMVVKQPTFKPDVKLLESIEKDSEPQTYAELNSSKIEEATLKQNNIVDDSKTAEDINAAVSTQVLVIEETEIIISSNATDEFDLAAMIKAVTAQYNSNQADQRRQSLMRDENKRQENIQINNKQNKTDVDDVIKAVDFLEEQASWLNDIKPTTDLPSTVWLNTAAPAGDTFTVVVELNVDKLGAITEVALLETSGNQMIDVAAMIQVRAGQLIPFKQKGIAVDAVVPMTLYYVRP